MFDFSHFTPHGFCLAWDPWLIWLMAGSDMLIAASYFSIPAALLVFLQRRTDLAFKPVFGLFAAFIMACGATHVMGALTLWLPAYRLAGLLNGLTALLSVATALTLWPLIPKALALPSPDSLRRANEALGREMALRDEAAAKLRDSEEQRKRIYARTPAALYAADAEGVLLDVSDLWLELTGYARAEVIGRHLSQFYAAFAHPVFNAQSAVLQAGLRLSRGERQLLCRDGSIRDIEEVFAPEYDAQGALLRVLGSAVDVTARKAAEAALRVTEEHLRQAQKMEAVGQLTGGIAHDFNNLLTTIMGSLELLQQRVALDARGERLVGNALEGSRRAARLTSQLLSFSRRQRLAPECLDPIGIIDGIRDLLARTLGDGITLDVSVPDEPWQLLADHNQMEAALLNLVINARDATAGAGHVRIEIANCRIEAMADFDGPDRLPPGDYVSVAVCDDGAGMDEAVRARAMEPFFTTKGPGVGTGLGLSQTYGFASQSGGTVRIESAPGKGSRIEMLLPRATAQNLPLFPAEPPPRARDGKGEHILLVEDDALLRQTMCEALRDRGYEVSAAEDGAHALRMLEEARAPHDFALLFTDIVMPGGMSGVDLALEARKRRATLPVLFATGYSTSTIVQTWCEPLDLLAKPYSPEDAAARIAARLDATAVA